MRTGAGGRRRAQRPCGEPAREAARSAARHGRLVPHRAPPARRAARLHLLHRAFGAAPPDDRRRDEQAQGPSGSVEPDRRLRPLVLQSPRRASPALRQARGGRAGERARRGEDREHPPPRGSPRGGLCAARLRPEASAALPRRHRLRRRVVRQLDRGHHPGAGRHRQPPRPGAHPSGGGGARRQPGHPRPGSHAVGAVRRLPLPGARALAPPQLPRQLRARRRHPRRDRAWEA